MNLATLVRDRATSQPDKPAIIHGEKTLTYAAAWEAIEALASRLNEQGVRRGDRVGLCLGDHIPHILAHYAVARLGAVIVPMDHRWSAAEKQRAASAFATALVLVDSDEISGAKTLNLTDPMLEPNGKDPGPIDERDGDLLISLSSGTTGKPKGALVTHSNFHARFKAQWQAIGYGVDDCFALLTPLYFGAGRSFAMSLLAGGGTVLLAPPPLKPPQIVAVLQDPRVTATFLPPTLLRRLLPLHNDGDPPLLGNIHYLLASGEPLFADEALACRRKLCPDLYSYYASSEGGGISLLKGDDFEAHADTVGRPMPDIEIQIVDTDDQVLPSGATGRLRYRGPSVADRYLDGDGHEQVGSEGGWFYPGDLAEHTPDGFIALRGRDKDVIIRGGVNIYPAEIEAALLQHADIDEVAVAGQDDSGRGQVVIAFVAGGDSLDADQLTDWCRTTMAPYKIPQKFVFLDELPKRSSGKVDKQALLSNCIES